MTNRDLAFLVDQLTNSMEFYSESEFATHMAEEIELEEETAMTLYYHYWAMTPHERMAKSPEEWEALILHTKKTVEYLQKRRAAQPPQENEYFD